MFWGGQREQRTSSPPWCGDGMTLNPPLLPLRCNCLEAHSGPQGRPPEQSEQLLPNAPDNATVGTIAVVTSLCGYTHMHAMRVHKTCCTAAICRAHGMVLVHAREHARCRNVKSLCNDQSWSARLDDTLITCKGQDHGITPLHS